MCKIIDIDRLNTLYPDNFNSRNRKSYFKAELEGTDIRGVLFTNAILGIVQEKNGTYTVTNKESYTHKASRCGLIPYNWIIDVDKSGDEIDTNAIFYCKFKKRKWRWGYYCVNGNDESFVLQKGLYLDRKPFKAYRYYLLTDNTDTFRHYIDVKRDNDAI